MKFDKLFTPKGLLFFWIIWAAYHLFTLSYSPVPWFDETFFASISCSVKDGEGFLLKAAPFYTHGKPVLLYGPVYFWMQAGIMYFIGLSEWAFRLLNFLSACGIIFFVNYALREKVGRDLRILAVLLLGFDTIFLQNAHSGRMDMLALVFVLCSYLPIVKKQLTISIASISGFCSLAAILTTPRSAIFLFPLGCWLLQTVIREKKVFQILVFSGIVVLGYFLWMVLGFGGVQAFVHYYYDSNTREDSQTLLNSFVGGNFYIPPYQLPLIMFTFLFFFFRKGFTWLTFICVVNIILFYLIIKDTGIYSALIIPFWIMLLAESLQLSKISQKFHMIPIVVIALTSFGIFFVKAYAILTTLNERNPEHISKWVSEHIPPKSKVVGDYKYFYAVKKNGSDFQFLSLGGNLADRANYQLETYKAEYVLVPSETDSVTIKKYEEKMGRFEKVKINPIGNSKAESNFFKRLVQKFGGNLVDGYSGDMYKVIR